MRTIARSFEKSDLVGGHPALDLVNTVNARNSDDPQDWLDGYDRLVEWALLAGVVEKTQATRLRQLASASASHSRAALNRARGLREALHAVFAALILERPVAHGVLADIDAARMAALRRTKLEMGERAIAARLSLDVSGLDLITDVVTLAAVELLAALPHDRARVCPGGDCGWLFLDTSKGGQRVWCDMATCGNAAKSKRFLKRRRRRSNQQ